MTDLKEPVPSITVSKEFLKDFKDYCTWMDFDKDEINDMRDCVRSNFDVSGKWIQKQMTIKRWAEEKWGGLPDINVIKEDLVKRKVCDAGSDMFQTLGYMMLLELCYDIS